MRYTDGMTAKEKTDLSRGFDAGNYGSAYEGQSWRLWCKARNMDPASDTWYARGCALGFFSSYELTEIPGYEMRARVASLRAAHDYDACGTCGASLPDDYLRAHPYETRVRACPDGNHVDPLEC